MLSFSFNGISKHHDCANRYVTRINTMDIFLKVFYKFNWIISITLEKYNI